MLVIGELINSSRKAIAQAIEQRDKNYIRDLALRQAAAGADYIDVNAGAGGNEVENMQWLVNLVQQVVDVPLCIDSPNPLAIQAGLELCKRTAMVNSISAEKERWDKVLPLIQKYKSKVIALCMDDAGIPATVEGCLKIGNRLVQDLTSAGIKAEDIYLDPLVKPVGVNHNYGVDILQCTRGLREAHPKVHLVSGLSNISYGLPERKLLNRVYLVMSAAMGMDAFILDPLDQNIMSLLVAANTLAGQDEYCMDYISKVRAGKIKA